jgi:hypothetical protein
MAGGVDSGSRDSGGAGGGAGLVPWAVLVVLLVVGGLLLSARAGDAYMAVSGLLFAGFGVLLGFRLMHRVLP